MSSRSATLATLAALLVSGAASARIAVSGRVIEAGGRPAAGVEVELLAFLGDHETGVRQLAGKLSPEPLAAATTGGDGTFRLEADEPGLYRLRVAEPDHRPMAYNLLPLLEETTAPTLELVPEVEVAVRVTDREGRPLPGAQVSARRPETRPERRARRGPSWIPASRRAVADGGGVARLSRGADETLTLRAWAAGHLEAETETRGSSVEVRLEPAVPHPLEVLDADGRPLPGALARLWETAWPVGVSDAKGRIELPLPAAGRLRLVVVSPGAGRVARWLEPESWPDDESRPVKLAPPRTLSGRVVDASTRVALAGALAWQAGSPDNQTRTDGTGGYALAVPAGGDRVWIWAATPGYFEQGAQVAERSAAGPTLALQRTSGVSGEVVDGEDRPVAGAEVTAAARLEPARRISFRLIGESRQALTDAAGRFRITRLHPGAAYRVRAVKPGFAPAEAEAHPAASGRFEPVRLVLVEGRTLSGVVVGTGGAGIAGARVALRRQPPTSSVRDFYLRRDLDTGEEIEAYSGETGDFAVRHLAAGRYELEASAAGFASTRVPGIEVPPGSGRIDVGSVEIEPGVRIEGRVSEAGGGPLAGAEIYVTEPRGGPRARTRIHRQEGQPAALTGVDGGFILEERRDGERVDLLVQREGFTSVGLPGVTAPTLEPLEVELLPAARVSGRVLDESGSPVSGAQVTIAIDEQQAAIGGVVSFFGSAGRAETGEDGRFVIDEAAAGELSLEARAPGYQRTRLAGLVVEPGRSLEDVELVLARGATVSGRVTAADGRPLAGVSIFEQGSQRGFASRPGVWGSSDGDGRYRLEGVEPGRRIFTAHHERHGRKSKELLVEMGENVLDISFAGGSRVSGRVVGEAGEPVPGASVSLLATSRSWGELSAVADADGAFAIEGIEQGTYRLRAEKPGYAPATSEGIEVGAGEMAGLELRLGRGGAIVGRLLGLDESDLAGIEILAMRQGDAAAVGQARPDGTYEIVDLAPGEWQVWATLRATGGQAEGLATVEPGGGETVLDLEFAAGLRLTGQVLSAARPVAAASVIASGIDVASQSQGTTDVGGRFRLSGLEAGRYRLQVINFQQGLRHQEEVALDFDRDIVVEIETARISGLVLDAADSSPIPGAGLELESLDAVDDAGGFAWKPTVSTDSTGYFKFSQASAGSYRLVARKDGYAPAELRVTAGPGSGAEDLELRLASTEGAALRVLSPAGVPPREIVAVVIDSAGRDITSGVYAPNEDGLTRLPSVPPGRWELLVKADGTAVAALDIDAPGEATVQLSPAAAVDITVPELEGEASMARVEIVGPEGRPFRGLRWIWPTHDWRMARGRARVEDLPPGSWSVTVEAPDGRLWHGEVTLTPGATTPLVLP